MFVMERDHVGDEFGAKRRRIGRNLSDVPTTIPLDLLNSLCQRAVATYRQNTSEQASAANSVLQQDFSYNHGSQQLQTNSLNTGSGGSNSQSFSSTQDAASIATALLIQQRTFNSLTGSGSFFPSEYPSLSGSMQFPSTSSTFGVPSQEASARDLSIHRQIDISEALANFRSNQLSHVDGFQNVRNFTTGLPTTLATQQYPTIGSMAQYQNASNQSSIEPSVLRHDNQRTESNLEPYQNKSLPSDMRMSLPSLLRCPLNDIVSPAPDSASTSTKDSNRPFLSIALQSDRESLTEYQSLLRSQIFLFEATSDDIHCSAQGRNRPIVVGQVGIICKHCSHLRPGSRSRGAVYFPSKLSGLYQAAQNMAVNHFADRCDNMPAPIRSHLLKLKEKKSCVLGGGKLYWANGGRVLGLREMEGGGLCFSEQAQSRR